MVDEELHFKTVLRRKNAAKARIYRKSVIDDKKSKRLKTALKENGTFDKRRGNDSTALRIPLSELLPNILNDGRGIANVEVSRQLHSSLKTKPSTNNNIISKRISSKNITKLGVNLSKRFDNTFAATTSNQDPILELQLNELFASDSGDDNMNDESDGYSSATNSSFDEDEMSNGTDAMETFEITSGGYYDIGDPVIQCQYCGANMWYSERKNKCRHASNPKFSMCCGSGKVQLPLLKPAPKVLQHLLFDNESCESKNFQQQIRMYNVMFVFTSPGAKVDNRFNNGRCPSNFRIQGQSCHRIGSMLPMPGQNPRFAQLYVYDTENEIENRMHGFRSKSGVDVNIVRKLSEMLYEHNVHAQSFRMARDRLCEEGVSDLKLRLISERRNDGRIYNQPTVSEVAALIVGDVDTAEKRDIIVQKQCGELQRPNVRHRDKGTNIRHFTDITQSEQNNKDIPWEEATKRNRLTIREWLAFRIQSRPNDAQTLLRSRRLYQQFLVDGFTMMESERLRWLRKNQSKLRVGKYHNLNEYNSNGETHGSNTGKRVVLPSSYVGSRRYMDQLYFDGMAICSYVGFPDLFITFTCNPNWPEIQRLLGSVHLKASDRPDIISRVFKMKFDEHLSDLTKKSLLGKVLAYMYTIEFQKRGLPHAHILIFLHPSNKYPTPSDIDRIILAEIPDQDTNEELYNLVKTHMIHGPCGFANRSSLCMKDGKCSKYFSKQFQPETIVDQDGFPVYRRRDNGHTVLKNGIQVDNRNVVPYNAKLLTNYLYVSPSEASWRIFSFPIHGRKPAVERLYFHCEGQNSVYYTDFDRINTVLEKPSVTESMFTSWFEANCKYPEAQNLTYNKFVSKFVYVKKKREWKPRQKGYTIGRLIWVPPTTGELYYLRLMLTHVKGPRSYNDTKTVNNVKYDTFRDACFAMGFIGDDREFIAAIKEANHWGSGQYLRLLFVHMLLSGSINRPRHVWSKTCHLLADGILYAQQRIANNRVEDVFQEFIARRNSDTFKQISEMKKKVSEVGGCNYAAYNISIAEGERMMEYDKQLSFTLPKHPELPELPPGYHVDPSPSLHTWYDVARGKRKNERVYGV
ncbi:hypothetical protein KIW84_055960 [Lathyrus oleraceus]|uniref:Helitron helicase-like domain-containing protein n=1 Tax=Pisum sativum TaxID=3888 RepID=A0A9D4WZ31_PEA|nr:hypothetical protein KIW84_055960 [Pisum sativum]